MSKIKLQIEITDPKLCPRYSAAVIDLSEYSEKPKKYLSVGDSYLSRVGMRPISRIVDVTNYLMLDTGQPLHAFDYDKFVKVGGVAQPKIIVRAAKNGEKLGLLDGTTIEMSEGDIVITSNDKPVALAGAMGGANTEIDDNTKRIIIESATFNLYNMRGTQFRHGIFSEAITRFTKGQPAALTAPVLNRATEMLAGKVLDMADTYPKPTDNKPVELTVEQINNLLGSDFGFDDIITTLENVGFKVKLSDTVLICKPPYWRTDIHIPEDVIEEVGRLNGYDNIPAVLPKRSFTAVQPDDLGELKSKIRQILSSTGANEVLTYSFVSEKLLEKVGQDPKNSYKITNSISPELQYVRQQIVPSLLEKTYENLKAGYDQFALFELNQVFIKSEGLVEKVPKQFDNLAFVIANGDFYKAKNYLTHLADSLGAKFVFKPSKPFGEESYFESKRSADVFLGDKQIGIVGEIKNSVLKNLKLPVKVTAFEMSTESLATIKKSGVAYQPQSQYPSVERDLTFRVSSDLPYAELENLICQTLLGQKLWSQLVPVSIYQGDDKTTKNISFRLTFASHDKTLTGKEITEIINKITSEAKLKLKAETI
jgi:phenylalanyl-tRNA synthetase beta chain